MFHVPGEISVVGCDDIFRADFCNPPLTTLTAPIEQAGRVAVSLLLSHLDAAAEPQRRAVVLPTHLTIRESTGPAPSAGRAIKPPSPDHPTTLGGWQTRPCRL